MKALPQRPSELLACIREDDVAPLANGKAETQMRFETAYLLRNGGMGDVERSRRLRKSAVPRGGVESPKGSQRWQVAPIERHDSSAIVLILSLARIVRDLPLPVEAPD